MLEELLKAIGLLVVAAGGLTAIAYAIFKNLGEKWLDARFDERLAAYKHEQQKELEQVRFKITALLDRATKLHQREFEVLPEAWSLLNPHRVRPAHRQVKASSRSVTRQCPRNETAPASLAARISAILTMRSAFSAMG